MHTHSILQSTPSPYLRIPNGTFLCHFNYISADWLGCALRLWNYLPSLEKAAIVAVDLERIWAGSIWLKLVNFMVTSSSGSTSHGRGDEGSRPRGKRFHQEGSGRKDLIDRQNAVAGYLTSGRHLFFHAISSLVCFWFSSLLFLHLRGRDNYLSILLPLKIRLLRTIPRKEPSGYVLSCGSKKNGRSSRSGRRVV